MRGVEQIPTLYDALMAVMEWSGLKRWRSWVAQGARGKTLEVGCGTGRNLGYYGEGAKVVAVEPDPAMLGRAKRRAPHALLVRAKAEALPFRDGAFDTVVSALVFCSVHEPDRGLSEVSRVLGGEGQLRMLEHVRAEGLAGRWQDFIQPAWTCVAGGCHPNRRTESTVEACGFFIEAEGRRSEGNMRRFSARKKSP